MPKTKKSRTKKTRQKAGHVLVLRLCRADMTSHDGFKWPESGLVAAPDWKPTKTWGNGLHGWLWGEGDHDSCNYFDGGKWLVVRVLAAECIDLGGKVKFPRGEVVHCGDQPSATAFIKADPAAKDRKVIGGTASAGDRGTASAGYRGTASAGDLGTASAGYRGTASAGKEGAIVVRYRSDVDRRWRLAVGYTGENGIEPGKPYHVEGGKLVEGELPEAKRAREEAAAISKKKPRDR